MAMTNRDLVDRGMDHLACGLGPFVDKRMTAVFPAGSAWIESLAARDPSRYPAGRRYSLSDPRFLLRVVTDEWRAFKDQLSRVGQGYATELKDAGNRWAHGDPFSAEDTDRILDTMERLLTAVGAAEQASQVRGLRPDLHQSRTGTTAPSPGKDAARPPAQARPGSAAGFWSRVTRADVVRATGEYERLGQEQFLAEHGFGRATAYLLVYRGRSYDSKAILGVAHNYATGVRIGPHEFNGGIYSAAGVLRRLGFDVRNIRDSAHPVERRATPAVTDWPHLPAPPPGSSARQPAVAALDGISRRQSLLVLTCSGRKQRGGSAPGPTDPAGWPQDLRDARARVLATAQADTSRVLPAWRRYTGTFYQHARPALADAVTHGHVVIISGGYGIARADEPIGWYDKMLRLADWPPGLLESALISEARRCGTQTVVAFTSATTDYARLLRRTPWQQAGIDARLITVTGVTGGAMSEVPRQLGQAFSAFWNHQPASYPAGTAVESLR